MGVGHVHEIVVQRRIVMVLQSVQVRIAYEDVDVRDGHTASVELEATCFARDERTCLRL